VIKKYFPFFFLIYSSSAFAQGPVFNWGLSIGGSDDERAYDIMIVDSSLYPYLSQNSLIVVGTTKSDDGNVAFCGTGTNNDQALYVVIDTVGNNNGCHAFGGSGYDEFDKGMWVLANPPMTHKVFLGRTSSNDGNVSGNHGNMDAWLVRVKFNTLISQKCIGGKAWDAGSDFIEMPDKGFMICGASASDTIDGQATNNHGFYDGWVIRTDSSGNIIWSRQYGGNLGDYLESIVRTTDGNFVCTGFSNSTDSTFSLNHGANDYWIIKIDTSGNLLWQKIYGGTGNDYAYKVIQSRDGKLVITGNAVSLDGDVVGNHSSPGASDVWVLKLNSAGNIIWNKCFGGSDIEVNRSIIQTRDNNFVIASSSLSNDGDLTNIQGFKGAWIFKIDSSGNFLWSKQFGSNSASGPGIITSYNSHSFYFLSRPLINGGNVPIFYGGFADIWFASISDTANGLGDSEINGRNKIVLYPNPVSLSLKISTKAISQIKVIFINSMGKEVLNQERFIHFEGSFDITDLASGLYFVKIISGENVTIKKIIKN